MKDFLSGGQSLIWSVEAIDTNKSPMAYDYGACDRPHIATLDANRPISKYVVTDKHIS